MVPHTPLGVRVLCGLLALIEIVLAVTASIFYYRRRHRFPLKGRGWKLAILAFGAVLIDAINIMTAVFIIDSYPAWLFAACYALAAVIASTVYMIRAWRLLFAFKLTEKMLELNELVEKGQFSNANALTESDWFVQHRHWLSSKPTTLVFVVCFVFSAAISALIIVKVRVSGPMELYIAISILAMVSAAWSVAWFLRSYSGDGLYVKRELSVTGTLVSVATIIYCGVWFSTGFFWIAPISRLVIYIVSGMGTGVLPIVLSYQVERQEQLVKKMDTDGVLRSILLDSFGAESFIKFAKTEFSTENVLFWRDMEKAKNPALPFPEVQDHLKRVYNIYISDSSTIQVNLPGDVRQRLDVAFASLGSSNDDSVRAALLEPWIQAQSTVFSLMKKDSFPRYLQSAQYTEYQQRKGTHVDIAVASHELTNLQHQSQRPKKPASNNGSMKSFDTSSQEVHSASLPFRLDEIPPTEDNGSKVSPTGSKISIEVN